MKASSAHTSVSPSAMRATYRLGRFLYQPQMFHKYLLHLNSALNPTLTGELLLRPGERVLPLRRTNTKSPLSRLLSSMSKTPPPLRRMRALCSRMASTSASDR